VASTLLPITRLALQVLRSFSTECAEGQWLLHRAGRRAETMRLLHVAAIPAVAGGRPNVLTEASEASHDTWTDIQVWAETSEVVWLSTTAFHDSFTAMSRLS
jgi:hypothetical protein